MPGAVAQIRQPLTAAQTGERNGPGGQEATMLAEIILLRLEAVIRGNRDTPLVTSSRFVPICRVMAFKHGK